jgi:hypothetical protein
VHLRGFGIRQTVTLPLLLHLGLRGRLRPSGKKFRGLLGIPSGETPASTEGKIDPNIRNVNNNFFMSFESRYEDE